MEYYGRDYKTKFSNPTSHLADPTLDLAYACVMGFRRKVLLVLVSDIDKDDVGSFWLDFNAFQPSASNILEPSNYNAQAQFRRARIIR